MAGYASLSEVVILVYLVFTEWFVYAEMWILTGIEPVAGLLHRLIKNDTG